MKRDSFATWFIHGTIDGCFVCRLIISVLSTMLEVPTLITLGSVHAAIRVRSNDETIGNKRVRERCMI